MQIRTWAGGSWRGQVVRGQPRGERSVSCLVAGCVFVRWGRLPSMPRLRLCGVPVARKVEVRTIQKASGKTSSKADLATREKLATRENLAHYLTTLNS